MIVDAAMIQLHGIRRTYVVGGQTVNALHGISLEISRADYLAVMGPSGSGKSTLLHVIGLLDRPDTGQYLLEGLDATALSDDELALTRREKIGFVFQFFHLVPRLTAAENIELPLILAGIPPEKREQRVSESLQLVELSDRAGHRPDQLSGGEQQRVAIARAIVMKPAVILADEPTGNLDRSSGQSIIAKLELLHAQGIMLIVVTHDPELGRRAVRQIRMVDGEIVADTGEAAQTGSI